MAQRTQRTIAALAACACLACALAGSTPVLSQGQAAVSRCSPETLPTLTGKLPPENLSIYSGSSYGNLYAFNAAQGAMRWCNHIAMLPQQLFIYPVYVPAPPPPKAVGTPVIAKGVVYVCSDNGYVYAFNASDGAYLWSRQAGVFSDTQPVIDNGVLYVDSQNGFYALNARDGSVRWKTSTALYSIFIAAGTLYGSSGNTLYALNASDGSVRWQFQNDGELGTTTPAVANGLVYITSSDSYRVYALDASDGSLRWSYWIGPGLSSPLVFNGVVYVTAGDSALHALNASDGTPLWGFKTNTINPDTPVLANGVIYLAADGLYALDTHSGRLLWHNLLASSLATAFSQPIVTNAGIFVQVGGADDNGPLDLLNPQDGTVLAQMFLRAAPHYDPPITSVVLAP